MSYAVSGKKVAGANGKVCSTTGNYCSFHLPRGVKKVYLSAVNAVGKSSPTEVRIHPPRGETDPPQTGLNSFRNRRKYDTLEYVFPSMCAMCFVSVAREVVSNVTVVPQDDRSLLVRWRSQPSSGLTGFVVEWRPLLQTDLSFTQFEFTAQNQTQLLIAGTFSGTRIYVPAILLNQ